MAEGKPNGGGSASTPPYVPFTTWKNFIGELKETVVPNRIDSGAMRSKSGSDQSGIRTAMKFFGLTDDEDNVLRSFQPVVDAHGTEGWPETLRDLLEAGYGPLIEDLDLDTGTTPQLSECFRRGGVSGSTLTKSIRFFLSAMDDAGIQYSPHLKPPKTPRSSKKRKHTESTAKENKTPPTPAEGTPPKVEGVADRVLAKIPEFDGKWEKGVQEKWFEALGKVIEMIEKK